MLLITAYSYKAVLRVHVNRTTIKMLNFEISLQTEISLEEI